MTNIEDLITSQREALLELGFVQRHGFLYVAAQGSRRVEFSIGSDDVWTVSVALWTSGGLGGFVGVDEVRLSPGVSMTTFESVASSLL